MKLIICPVFYSTILHLGLGDKIVITFMSINMINFGQYKSIRTDLPVYPTAEIKQLVSRY